MAIFSTTMSIVSPCGPTGGSPRRSPWPIYQLVALVPETHGPTLLKWRVAKEGNAPPPLSGPAILDVYKVALSRPIIYLFSEPVSPTHPPSSFIGSAISLMCFFVDRHARQHLLINALRFVEYQPGPGGAPDDSAGILYGFFEAFSIVYVEIRGFKLTSYGLTYISLGLGFLFACGLLATVGRESS